MPNTKEDNVDRKLITNITIDGLEYELIHIPKEVKDAIEKSKQPKPDYVILSIMGQYSKRVYRLENTESGNLWLSSNGNGFSHDISKGLQGSNCEIHSVKRLRDNEVFNIGDVCDSLIPCKIDKIYIHDNGVCSLSGEKWGCPLDMAKKYKPKVLFTSNDGKEIYENDLYWTVDNLFTMWYSGGASDKFDSGKNKSCKYFSTEEAANEYVTLHKPVLSAQDIIDYFESWVVKPSEYTKNNVIKLAKSKLK